MSKSALRRTIHVGCKQLGLDQDARRDLQLLVTKKASMSNMTEADMKKFVSALKQRGFKVTSGRRKPAGRADIRYCHVLWGLLFGAGHARIGGAKGLNAFVRSRFEKTWGHVPIDIDAMTEAGEINQVVEALKAWCTREGIPTELGGRG